MFKKKANRDSWNNGYVHHFNDESSPTLPPTVEKPPVSKPKPTNPPRAAAGRQGEMPIKDEMSAVSMIKTMTRETKMLLNDMV